MENMIAAPDKIRMYLQLDPSGAYKAEVEELPSDSFDVLFYAVSSNRGQIQVTHSSCIIIQST